MYLGRGSHEETIVTFYQCEAFEEKAKTVWVVHSENTAWEIILWKLEFDLFLYLTAFWSGYSNMHVNGTDQVQKYRLSKKCRLRINIGTQGVQELFFLLRLL